LNTTSFYLEVAKQIPPGTLPFMNYGYAGQNQDYSWLCPGDEPYRYNLNLVRLALRGVVLDGVMVLECGSGRGGNCHYLDRYTEARAIFGIDSCEPHVRLSAGRYQSRRTQFLCADAGNMPLPPDCADVLLNLESSHCYPDLARFLSEVRRVLKPGGLFAYADLWGLSLFDYDWTARQSALERCGLLTVREEDISDGVFRALQIENGLSSTVRRAASPENAPLIEAILRANDAMRLTLASRQCRYRVILMRKPPNAS
jgi:O-methyltransferase